ncbi:MAG: cation-translocating P-type ATPase [Clostridiales bacterium]|nr:cation-translocating P-type ATPase [Clostridiales bacterium]
MAYFNKDISNIYKEFDSCIDGLKSSNVNLNREKFGSNETEKQKRVSFFVKFLMQFKNLMIIILILSAVISCTMAIIHKDTENLLEGVLIFVIVIINSFVGVIQEQKAENALAALAQKTVPLSLIKRDGSFQKTKLSDIVAGDIISLKAGDYIPADIRIIECSNFKCDESSLTGENQSVQKSNKLLFQNSLEISAQENMCFSGTTATSGKAIGIVVATGKKTELGKIAKILKSSKKEKTPLEKNIDKIGKVISIVVLVIVAVVFAAQLIFNKSVTFLDALLTAVALAVAAIPESLPAVITIIMALGVQKLAKQNAIVKRLSSVETLGCCTTICTDKTGTITQNKMSVKHVFSSMKTFTEKDFSQNLNPDFYLGLALCNNITKSSDGQINADATETAIANYLISQNYPLWKSKEDFVKINEIEFNSSRKFMSITCKINTTERTFFKGAIDYILPKCSHIYQDGKVVPLTEQIKSKILTENEKICALGERVIAFAQCENNQDNNLTFSGFLGIIDPPRPEVYKSIKLCKKAGLKVVMITGDHLSTAFAIAKEVGIAKNKNESVLGSSLDKLSDKELLDVIDNYSVFARVTPEHKLRIVKALKHKGNVVAMTGDGINDAPSIKNANIGLCMGITGTDVTKEAADIIIADDNFSTIVSAIKEGRGIYNNITKTILFLISTNLVEVLGLFVTSLVIPNAIFLLPAQILFINLVTDSLPAFALGIEPPEKDIMNKPPRNPNKTLLSGNTGTSILLEGFIQTLVVLVMFVIANHKYGNEVASTMSFMTICLMQIIHAINCKTERSIFRTNIFNNKFFNLSFIFLFSLILGIYFLPFFADIFSLTTLDKWQWLYVGVTSIAIIPAVEICKLFIKEKEMD